MKLSGLTWRSCEGSKWAIGRLQAGRSTRYPATNEAPECKNSIVKITLKCYFYDVLNTSLIVYGTDYTQLLYARNIK